MRHTMWKSVLQVSWQDSSFSQNMILCRVWYTEIGIWETIQYIMDYADCLRCHTTKSHMNKWQCVQNSVAQIIIGNFEYRQYQFILLLIMTTVQAKCDYFTTVLMFKGIHVYNWQYCNGWRNTWLYYQVIKLIWCHNTTPQFTYTQTVNLSIMAVSSAIISMIMSGWLLIWLISFGHISVSS